jgi:cytochrome P450
MDPPEHTRLRATVAGDFTLASLKRLRPAIAAHAGRLVEAMAGRGAPVDLVAHLAVPLPALTAAELLGVPVTDRPVFQADATDLQTHDISPVRRSLAAGRMNRYLAGLVGAKRDRGGTGDLLGRLATGHHGLDVSEQIGVASLILVAGLETTTGILGLAVLSLLNNLDQAELLRSHPTHWAERAIREALRYWTVVHHGLARVATGDTTVGGRSIKTGDAVVVHLPSANRDPQVFARPDRFDITRDSRNHHLAFGHGIHHCLGGQLAQMQASIALAELFGRLPALRLAAPLSELRFLENMLVYGLSDLPVGW